MTTDGHNIRAQNLQPERWISYHAGAAAPAQRSPGRRASDDGLALLAARSVLPAADMMGLSAASDIFGHAVLPDLAYAAVVVAMLAGSGLYRRRITGRVSGQVSRIVVAAAVALPVLLVWLSMAAALELALSVALAIIVLRDLAYRGLRAAHKRDLLAEPTLLVGAGDLGAKIADLLLRHPETGLRPVGFVDGRNAAHELPLPVVGAPAELPDLIFRYQIRRVIG
jgi:FlaA1/EpsC-like NDP-sugar epimerase